jgi:hypothetical protein
MGIGSRYCLSSYFECKEGSPDWGRRLFCLAVGALEPVSFRARLLLTSVTPTLLCVVLSAAGKIAKSILAVLCTRMMDAIKAVAVAVATAVAVIRPR